MPNTLDMGVSIHSRSSIGRITGSSSKTRSADRSVRACRCSICLALMCRAKAASGLTSSLCSRNTKATSRIIRRACSANSTPAAGDIKAEIINLFAAKMLNFVRNPFSIVKVLNSFPGLASYDPTDPALLADYRRVVSGRKPQQAHLCAELGISEAQYVEWLRVLFMLLVPMAEGHPNFFEDMIKRLLENRKKHVAAVVFEYDSARCLLSDRGFSQPIADGPHMAFSFNLCATAFVDYSFVDPATIVQGKASPEFIARAIANWERLPEKQISVTSRRNDLDVLARYNRRAIEQCYKRVYCSVKDGLVLSAPSFTARC